MNCTRKLIQHSGRLRYTLLSSSHYRTRVAMLHTRICQRIDSSCRYTRNIPLKVQLPLTWSVCNYAKKAGKEKKGGKKTAKVAKVDLNQEDIGDIIDLESVKKDMQEVVDRLKENYIQNLNLRSSAGSYDRIIVETSEGKFHLNELGQITQKSPQMLMISLGAVPQHIKAVKKALDESGMNINAQQEGNTIFIPLPKVTKEHRESLAKNAKTLFEKTKTQISSLLNKSTKKVNLAKSTHSEDLIRNINNLLIDITHQYQSEAESLMEQKQKELLGE